MEKHSPRVLIYDIETSFNVAAIFQLKTEYVPHGNLLSERHLICACWKWLGESKVYSVSLLDDPKRFAKDIHDDYHVVKTLYDVMATADCLVAHNGDFFDRKYMETRALVHGLKPLPPITTIDTYKIAKSRFMFNANRLDYIGKFLGFGGKKPTPQGLWLDVLRGEKKAIRTMVDYNKRDVTLLEKIFLRFRPYMSNHMNRELFGGTGCPRCGSKHVQYRGFHKAITQTYRRLQCQTCSGWFRELQSVAKSRTKTRVL